MRKRGFTLIELSIVLVIIGLIVGGILVGRDLIHASEVRAQISQLRDFDLSVFAFKQRYGALPGDIPNPTNFSLYYGCVVPHYGNNNGIIDDANGAYPILQVNCESIYFFVHLAQANMVKNLAINSNYSDGAACGGGNYAQYVGCQFPEGKIGVGGFAASSLSNGNLGYFFGITNKDPSLFNPVSINNLSSGGVIIPADAYALDVKLDDGAPLSGRVKSVIYPATPDTVASNCITSVANNTYNLTKTTVACNLMIQASLK